jgi:hypothetical protein
MSALRRATLTPPAAARAREIGSTGLNRAAGERDVVSMA